MTDSKATIRVRSCRRDCGWTLSSKTHGGPDDVRLCSHGRIWIWTRRQRGLLVFDVWRPLRWWLNPGKYRRAAGALSNAVTESSMSDDHEHVFVEEQEPNGRLILGPCLICDLPAMEAAVRLRRVDDLHSELDGFCRSCTDSWPCTTHEAIHEDTP